MKFLFLFLIAILCVSTTAFADMEARWSDTFYKTYYANGIDAAVLYGLSEAKSPDEIVKTALPIEGLDEPLIIQALFCAAVLPGDIYAAAEENAISEETVAKGYELALASCAEKMEDSLAIVMSSAPQSSSSQGSTYASPSTF